MCRLLGVPSCHREFTEHTQATSQGCPNCTLRSAGIGIAGNANCAVTWLGIMRGKSLLQRESARVQREELERLPSVEPPSAHRPACLCTLAADAASSVAVFTATNSRNLRCPLGLRQIIAPALGHILPLQPQLAPGGYNCSKALKMELAVTCISSWVITARHICLLLWRSLMRSCNQQCT